MSAWTSRLERTISGLTARLLERRHPEGHWEGQLASSALSTATAVVAMVMAGREGVGGHERLIERGAAWLIATQNADGGWGDTVRSRSNLSTTLLAWAALAICGNQHPRDGTAAALDRAGTYLRGAVGELTPQRIQDAIVARYGKDRTFSVPILTVLAMTGRLGGDAAAWRLVPQLPFELAALPHRFFQWLRLPVVSYALPALIAIGQVRHHFAPTRVAPLRALRTWLAPSTRDDLLAMQPDSGGYLEATPLTSFVVMSLIAAGHVHHPVAQNGLAFLAASVREDGSWPIDTNLSTWVTTLAVSALGADGVATGIDPEHLTGWLLRQQHLVEHPFTHAAPGGWAWTDLAGGVPDADDTAGALVALRLLSPARSEAARLGVEWLLGLQNTDGGIPTFCRGWGALPFDRSAPDLTAHAVQAWTLWRDALPPGLGTTTNRAVTRAIAYLLDQQRDDGAWLPLWFGNEHAPDEQNPVYGTSRVLAALAGLPEAQAALPRARQRAVAWLRGAQNADGGWGGAPDTPSSIEETGLALQALARYAPEDSSPELRVSIERAVAWLADTTDEGRTTEASPIGLYFARLWYYEELYPIIFALGGLLDTRRAWRAARDSPA